MKACRICLKRRKQAIQQLNAAMMGLERAINRTNVKRAMKACEKWLENDPHCPMDHEYRPVNE